MLGIILRPALAAVIQILATFGLLISMVYIYFGLFAELPRDPNRLHYQLGTMQLQEIAKAVERYKADCGEYPSGSVGLDALIRNPGAKGWNGPYFPYVPLDPWGRPYKYLRSTGAMAPRILSYAADGKLGGTSFDADITNWDLYRAIPDSPYEIHARRVLIGSWMGAWCCLIACGFALMRTSRRRKG